MGYDQPDYHQYPSANEDYRPQKKKKGRFIGRVLLVAAILAVPVWLCLRYQFTWDISEEGFHFSLRQEDYHPNMAVLDPAQVTESPAQSQPQAPALQQGKTSSDTTLDVNAVASHGQNLSLQEIYTKLRPSVVSIVTTTTTGQSTGTGIVMSTDGYIITNNHVIDDGVAIEIVLFDDTRLDACLVGADENSDLAVLKVESNALAPAQFGDSNSVQVGDDVVAIGDPLGIQLRGTMTNGIISAINRNLGGQDGSITLLQTNAALNSGNSGGPLINEKGQVIGINAMKIGNKYASATVEGLGFAIPIASAKPIIDGLITKGYVAGQPAIGIVGETLPASARIYYRLPVGVYITYVAPDSHAYEQGLSEGDILLSVNGHAVETPDDLSLVLSPYAPGDHITAEIFRQGDIYSVDIILIDKNAP